MLGWRWEDMTREQEATSSAVLASLHKAQVWFPGAQGSHHIFLPLSPPGLATVLFFAFFPSSTSPGSACKESKMMWDIIRSMWISSIHSWSWAAWSLGILCSLRTGAIINIPELCASAPTLVIQEICSFWTNFFFTICTLCCMPDDKIKFATAKLLENSNLLERASTACGNTVISA